MSILLAAAFVLGLMVCAIFYLRSQRRQTLQQLGRSSWPFRTAVALTALLGLGLVTSLVSKTAGGKHSRAPTAVTTAVHKPAPHVKKPAAPATKPKPRVRKAKAIRPKPRPKAKPRVVYRPTTVVRTVTVTHTVTVPQPPAITTTSKLAPDPAPPALWHSKPKPKPKSKSKPSVFGSIQVLVSLPGSCRGVVALRVYHPKGGYAVRSVSACTNVRLDGVRLGDNICQVIRPPLRLAPLNSVCKRVLAFGNYMVFAQVFPAGP